MKRTSSLADSRTNGLERAPMERPVLNPIDVRNPPSAGRWRRLLRVGRWLPGRKQPRREVDFIEERSLFERVIREILYRAILLPPLAILVSAVLVYERTHPPQALYSPDPMSQEVYYEPVSLLAEDGVRLDAWLVPALEPRDILDRGLDALMDRRPAVVLAHGFGMSREQVLPLIRPLHDHGFVVLAVGLRGSGLASAVGQTFGLNEALDVEAAVNLLRRRSYVDPTHIAVVGVGTGANAALLTADRDSGLAALALDAPIDDGEEALAAHCGGPALNWLAPLYRWTFQIGYGLNLHDLDMERYGRVLASRPTLLLRWSDDAQRDLPPERVRSITKFLAASLDPPGAQADSDH
jgi:pimeloyl-ACP methyl ester carboxylesterase